MEKKLKLSISGTSKKTINNIEKAKLKSKNSVIIEKPSVRHQQKNFSETLIIKYQQNQLTLQQCPFKKPNLSTSSDFEKRKLAEQRATKIEG